MECCNSYSNAENSMRLLTACRSNNYGLVQKIIYSNVPKKYHRVSTFLSQKPKTQFRVLYRLRAFINTCDEGGYSSLHYATLHDNAEMLRLLLVYGASPLCIDNDSKTVVHMACERGNVECLNTILGFVLYKAKETNDYSGLEALLTAHDSVKKNTPLLITGLLGTSQSIAIMERLLYYVSEMPINNALRYKTEISMLTAKTKNNETILHLASRQNNPQLVTLVLSTLSRLTSGTKDSVSVATFVNEKNNKGSTALCVACDNKVAALNEDGYIIGTLCANGARLDLSTDRGWFPIHRAALSGHFAGLKILATMPTFNPNIGTVRDPAPLYALHLLAKNGSAQAYEATKFLLNHGAEKSIFLKDALFWCPLHYAAESNGEATHLIAELILKKVLEITGNDYKKLYELVQSKDDEYLTPTMKAAENGHIKFLITVFAMVKTDMLPNILNAKFSKNDYTALHFACQNGYMEVVKLLVENRADIYARDKQGLVPEQTAKRFHNNKIADFLKSYAATKKLSLQTEKKSPKAVQAIKKSPEKKSSPSKSIKSPAKETTKKSPAAETKSPMIEKPTAVISLNKQNLQYKKNAKKRKSIHTLPAPVAQALSKAEQRSQKFEEAAGLGATAD